MHLLKNRSKFVKKINKDVTVINIKKIKLDLFFFVKVW